MRNRHLLRTALIGALCAGSACTAQEQSAVTGGQRTVQAAAPTSTASIFSVRASSANTVRADHYEVPPDYDNDVASHPYTSGLGPCPDGGMGARCLNTIPASHYNR